MIYSSNMKKLVLTCTIVLAGMLTGFCAFAQQADEQTEVEAYEVYCELISTAGGFFSNKTTVEVDFGQFASYFSNDRQLVDEQGRTIEFNSLLDAANYMAERGWVFKQAYIIMRITDGDSGTPIHHWIMGKKITDKSQISEGLYTAKMMR